MNTALVHQISQVVVDTAAKDWRVSVALLGAGVVCAIIGGWLNKRQREKEEDGAEAGMKRMGFKEKT